MADLSNKLSCQIKNFTRNNFVSKSSNDYGKSTNIREHKSIFDIFKIYKKSFFYFYFFVKNAQTFFFFFLNQGIPGFAQTNLRPGWQGLLKRPAADEERGRTPDLVSDESAPNRSARTSWVQTFLFRMRSYAHTKPLFCFFNFLSCFL